MFWWLLLAQLRIHIFGRALTGGAGASSHEMKWEKTWPCVSNSRADLFLPLGSTRQQQLTQQTSCNGTNGFAFSTFPFFDVQKLTGTRNICNHMYGCSLDSHGSAMPDSKRSGMTLKRRSSSTCLRISMMNSSWPARWCRAYFSNVGRWFSVVATDFRLDIERESQLRWLQHGGVAPPVNAKGAGPAGNSEFDVMPMLGAGQSWYLEAWGGPRQSGRDKPEDSV